MKKIYDNEYNFSLARILNESKNDKNSLQGNAKKLLSSLNNIDLTTDNATEGLYYAISSFFNINILILSLPFIPKILREITYKHANTKVLPKYRTRLMSIYKNKIKMIENEIDELNNSIDEKNRGDIMEKIENLNIMKDNFQSDYDKLSIVK